MSGSSRLNSIILPRNEDLNPGEKLLSFIKYSFEPSPNSESLSSTWQSGFLLQIELMELNAVSDKMKCRAFPVTLKGQAR